MLPSRIIYRGKLFETIGFIKLNKGSFLIVKNNDEVYGLDLSKLNLNLDLKFEVKEATKAESVFIEYVIESIKNDIKKGKYQTKEDLKKEIIELNRFINEHNSFLSNIDKLTDSMTNRNMISLLTYFDETMKETPLDLEAITSFKVDGKSYIKYEDENGKVRILDDNVDNRNFVEQFKAKQNESFSFQLEEVDEITEAPKNQVLPTIAMQKYDEKQDKDIVGNAENGIYYDQNSGQILTSKREDNKIIINEVKEATSETNEVTSQSQTVDYPAYNEETVDQYLIINRANKINLDAFINKYLYDLTPKQIDYLLNNYPLTQDQIDKLNAQESTKIVLVEEQKEFQKEKPKTKVLTLNNKKAAFVDTLLLSFVVGLVSGMYLVLLVIMIMS
ncbi:MAG TPA: hypothetical protein IAC20_05665 [Candidatus Faecisoma merdavium]|nr:hypothetical protein [Candidatus Faecisoma merdavium]